MPIAATVPVAPELTKREAFSAGLGQVRHSVDIGAVSIRSVVKTDLVSSDDPKGAWWTAYLRGLAPKPELGTGHQRQLRTVDLFCGPGGLANGLRQVCRELGIAVAPELIVDLDLEATQVYAANHSARKVENRSVASFVDFTVRHTGSSAQFLYKPELTDDSVHQSAEGVDIVLAGPPCQGHSNLNNHTRRDDPRNDLYLTVPAFAVASAARMCIIENVPAVLHDRDQVVSKAEQLFLSAGYNVTSGVLNAAHLGWPQSRKRHFMIARLDAAPIPIEQILEALGDESPRSLWWAIGDLEDVATDQVMDYYPSLSDDNIARIDWLFDNGAHELDLPERPLSHRGGTTYNSVYGRMHKDKPAPTITTGFTSPGRGRYVHPTRRRVLTPHEAARVQGFPDSYKFVVDPSNPPGRVKLAKWIGDAVPMPLGYAAALSALAGAPIWR